MQPFIQTPNIYLKGRWILSSITFNIQLFSCYPLCSTLLFSVSLFPNRAHPLPANSLSKQPAGSCVSFKINFLLVNWMQNRFRLVCNRLPSARVSAASQEISATFLCCMSPYGSWREPASVSGEPGNAQNKRNKAQVLPPLIPVTLWQPLPQMSYWVIQQDGKFMSCSVFKKITLALMEMCCLLSEGLWPGNHLSWMHWDWQDGWALSNLCMRSAAPVPILWAHRWNLNHWSAFLYRKRDSKTVSQRKSHQGWTGFSSIIVSIFSDLIPVINPFWT